MNNLSATIGKLTAEIKAKESIIKDLNEQVRLAEIEKDERIRAAKEAVAERKAELELSVAPLQSMVQDVARRKQEIEAMKAEAEHVKGVLKAEKQAVVFELDSQIASKRQVLHAIQEAIAAHKSSVAAL